MGSSAQVEGTEEEASERRREAIIVDLLLQPAAHRRQIRNGFQDVLNTSADLQPQTPSQEPKGPSYTLNIPGTHLRTVCVTFIV